MTAPDAPTPAGRPDGPVAVDFHFDVMCPWAYQTSRWIRRVRDAGLVDVRWRFFSLEEVNREEGKKHPWEREWSYGWGMLRVAAMLRRGVPGDDRSGNDLVDRYYATAGAWLHEQARKPHSPDGARRVLAEIGVDPGVVDRALADRSTDDDVLADHRAVTTLGGFGVPTLVFPSGRSLYGPVVVPAPEGDEAIALWDLVTAWERFPHLYEIKRPKSADDLGHIARAFTPYLEGRDWRSVERAAP